MNSSGNISQAPEGVQELYRRAKKSVENSYSPYSRFAVGCALRSKNQKIYCGANIENACYNLGICAERVAIQAAASDGTREIQELLVVTPSNHPSPPCGACRQVIAEFGNSQTLIHATNLKGAWASYTLDQLLPYRFDRQHMDDRPS